MAGMAIFMLCGRGKRCLVALGGVKKWAMALDALGGLYEKREVEEEEERGCPGR